MSHDADTERAPNFHLTSLRLTRSQYDRLKEIAGKQERTVSQEVRLLVTRHLDALEDAEEIAA